MLTNELFQISTHEVVTDPITNHLQQDTTLWKKTVHLCCMEEKTTLSSVCQSEQTGCKFYILNK